jgi:hypothetical protein
MTPLKVAAWWLLVMGAWPLADPGHAGDTPASTLDIALHVAAGLFLIHHYLTRHPAAKETP